MKWPRVALFIVACALSGFGGALGSIVGHAAGARWLWVGGIAGGLLGAAGSALIARGRRWIQPSQLAGTIIGACVGFLLAAAIATNTLGSPVGPVLSTLLVGTGALLGARGPRAR